MNNLKNIIDVNRKAYDQLATEFNSKDSSLNCYKKSLEEYISKYVKHGASALEIGPGTGFLLRILENLGCSTTAIELSEQMCKLAKGNSPNTVIINQDVLTVNFPHNQFDIVCALAVIHTLPLEGAITLLGKVKSWLKDDGFLVLDTVAYAESKGCFMLAGQCKTVKKFRKQYTKNELEELICSSGFKVVDMSFTQEEKSSKIWMRFACKK